MHELDVSGLSFDKRADSGTVVRSDGFTPDFGVNDPRYQLRIVSSAGRHLTEVLLETVATAAFEFITGPLLENPHRVGKQLREPLADRYSARRGAYRIIYRIDDETRMVTVLAIGYRGEIYRS